MKDIEANVSEFKLERTPTIVITFSYSFSNKYL